MAQRVTARSTTDLVLRVLREAHRPLSVEQILAGVQQIAPVHSANPKNTMRKAISQMFLVQPTHEGDYAYLPYLLSENRFRHPIERGALTRRSFLLGPELVTALWPATFEIAKRRDDSPAVLLLNGRKEAEAVRIHRAAEGWGFEAEPAFWSWLESLNPHTGDELLFTVLDADARRYDLQLLRHEERDEGAIAERNLEVANLAEGLLKAAHDAVILSNLAVRLIGMDVYRHPIPPDPLAIVLRRDERFVDAGLDMVALADRWPGYAEQPVDMRRLMGVTVGDLAEESEGD
ncbi:MAG: hypothetical protein ACUVX9_03220 [Anaerolineae bacterium]